MKEVKSLLLDLQLLLVKEVVIIWDKTFLRGLSSSQ